MTGLDLAIMAAVVALAWFGLRWSARLDRYEDELELRDRERRREIGRELDSAPRELYVPYDFERDSAA